MLPYNDLDAVRAAFDEHSERIAAVIVEAAAANMGVLAPERGFNRGLSEITRRHGALLIVDEVLTGFRVGPRRLVGPRGVAGRARRRRLGARPHHVRQGHRRRACRSRRSAAAPRSWTSWRPSGRSTRPARSAATRSPSPPASRRCGSPTPEVYARLDAVADVVAPRDVGGALAPRASRTRVQRAGNLFSFAFTSTAPANYDDVRAQEAWRYPPFFHAMLDAGVNLPPSVFEAWFVTAAHDDAGRVAHPRRAARCGEGRRRGGVARRVGRGGRGSGPSLAGGTLACGRVRVARPSL